jgi:hypothetical protein
VRPSPIQPSADWHRLAVVASHPYHSARQSPRSECVTTLNPPPDSVLWSMLAATFMSCGGGGRRCAIPTGGLGGDSGEADAHAGVGRVVAFSVVGGEYLGHQHHWFIVMTILGKITSEGMAEHTRGAKGRTPTPPPSRRHRSATTVPTTANAIDENLVDAREAARGDTPGLRAAAADHCRG